MSADFSAASARSSLLRDISAVSESMTLRTCGSRNSVALAVVLRSKSVVQLSVVVIATAISTPGHSGR